MLVLYPRQRNSAGLGSLNMKIFSKLTWPHEQRIHIGKNSAKRGIKIRMTLRNRSILIITKEVDRDNLRQLDAYKDLLNFKYILVQTRVGVFDYLF